MPRRQTKCDFFEFFLLKKNNKITNKSTYLLHFLVAHVRTHGCKTITYESTFSIRLIIKIALRTNYPTTRMETICEHKIHQDSFVRNPDNHRLHMHGWMNFKVRFFHFLEKKEEKNGRGCRLIHVIHRCYY